MRLLLTNDDGVLADGILALAAELSKEHEVVIVAPDSQRSGNSQKITLRKQLAIKRVKIPDSDVLAYSTDGTPADCTRIGIYWLEDKPFDAVITGINMGSNVGTDVLYSGTVGAAREASMHRLPALAVSLAHYKEDYLPVAAKYAAVVIRSGVLDRIPEGTMLNLNVPSIPEDQIKGIRWVRHGFNQLSEVIDKTETTVKFNGMPRVGKAVEFEDDFWALDNGWASISPLNLDMNDLNSLKMLSESFDFAKV